MRGLVLTFPDLGVREEGVTISTLRRSLLPLAAGAAFLMGLAPAIGAQAASPPTPPVMTGAQVSPAVHVDVSPPLREMIENQQDQQGNHENHPAKPYHQPGFGRSANTGTPSSTTSAAAPATALNFDGVGNGFSGPQGTFAVNSAPPDTNLAVGPNHVVEIVNTDFAIFNKSGVAVYGPVQINTLWSGFGGMCQTDNDGDPIAKYDSIANRWVISQFAITSPNPNYLQCVAVSTTGDPTGTYYRYSFSYGNQFPDYPKMGVWPDAYYITFNMFNSGGNTFLGGKACAYDRSRMLTGASATQQCFDLGTTYGGLLPSDLDGSRSAPAGSPNYIVADGAGSNQLAYWSFHTDWTSPAKQWARVDLPEPLSPTMASDSPAARVKLTPRSAATSPPKHTARSRTSRSGAPADSEATLSPASSASARSCRCSCSTTSRTAPLTATS